MTIGKSKLNLKQVAVARDSARASGEIHIDPSILFDDASEDDLSAYTPQMWAAAACFTGKELSLWDGSEPRVTVVASSEVQLAGQAVAIIAVTGRNIPFLFDSVMGEVTSTYSDIRLAVHPILSSQDAKTPERLD